MKFAFIHVNQCKEMGRKGCRLTLRIFKMGKYMLERPYTPFDNGPTLTTTIIHSSYCEIVYTTCDKHWFLALFLALI